MATAECRGGNRGLYLYFFGEDGKTRMPLRKFDEFLKSLHDEIVRLEFTHYDYQGKVSFQPALPVSLQMAQWQRG